MKTTNSIFDVAKYILQKIDRLTSWKLQKLCYYSQAWKNGPVCKKLFEAHKGKYSIIADDLRLGNPDELTDEQKDTIDKVIEAYGNMMPYQLREQTHFEEPWKIARGDCKEGEYCSNIVTKSSMGEYYGSL